MSAMHIVGDMEKQDKAYPEDVLLIFVGHSDDANEEAQAILGLQVTLERKFREYLALPGVRSGFRSLHLWEWNKDASSKPGGQQTVVAPVLSQAMIALFVFKERIGAVTWEELEQMRERSHSDNLRIIALFPAKPPDCLDLSEPEDLAQWSAVVSRRDELTRDWTNTDSTSVTPLARYRDAEHLKIVAFEGLEKAIHSIFCEDKPAWRKETEASNPLIEDNRDISFDQRKIMQFKVDDLDDKLIKAFTSSPLSKQELSKKGFMQSSGNTSALELLGYAKDGVPSLGAFFCFAPSLLIQDKFVSCSLHMVRYKGVRKNSLEAAPQHGIFRERDNIINLFQKGFHWLISDAGLSRQGIVGSSERDDLEIPELALREALANALVHRNYEDKEYKNQPTRIEVYDDRVVITSYGDLVRPLTIDKLNRDSDNLDSYRRNPVIAEIFLHTAFMELNASGITRMRLAMQKVLLPPPRITIRNGVLAVCFQRPIGIDFGGRPVEIRKRALIGGDFTDFERYGNVIRSACIAAGYYPVMMEHHPDNIDDFIALSKHMVDLADMYICMLGDHNSFMHKGLSESITQFEYTAVKRREKMPSCYLCAKNSGVARDEEGVVDEQQMAFFRLVKQEQKIQSFDSVEGLRCLLDHFFRDKVVGGRGSGANDLETCYKNILKEVLGKIRLLGSPAIDSIQVGLEDTFVPLRISHTWKTDYRFSKKKWELDMREEMRTHTPDELMRKVFPAYRMLLVIGDPGAGKTTLLKYYALCCLQEKQDQLFGDSLPVRVFYLPLRELKLDENRQYRTLPEQLSLWSSVRANVIEANVFDGWLRNVGGTKSLVLLDGLDEISDLELRKAACNWIDRQHSGFPETYFVVTSRLTGYRKTEGVELEADHIRADVMDFTAEQQEEFLSKWFKAAYIRELCPVGLDPEAWIESRKKAAEERTKTIVEYLGKEENRGLRELAAVPMMLQIMAILWKEREFLPGNRVKLYGAALDYLLEYRDERRRIPPLLPANKARLVLASVALWMQEELDADEAERSAMHTEMQKVLSTLDHPPSAVDFCKNLIDRAGLLVEYGEERREYLFRHKTFREYLAGSQLTEKIKRNSGLIAQLVEHFGEDWWNEPLTFFMAQADAAIFDTFMEALFDSGVSAEFSSKQQTLLQTVITEAPQKTTDALCRKLLEPDMTANRQWYILDCLRTLRKETAMDDVNMFLARGLAKNEDIRGRAEDMVAALSSSGETTSCLSAIESDFVLISGGQYVYSVTGTALLVPELFVAKYPVTNRQYRSFIVFLAGKFRVNEQFLSLNAYMEALIKLARSGDDSVQGLEDYLKDEHDLVQRFRSAYDDDRKFNKDEQPVVGVSWYDARAYCLWLSMLSGEEYRLPTEEEWEWAAGGRREEPGKVLRVREYPWGEESLTPKHANYSDNEGAPTPVGRYPDGATPEGLYDMAGNVWEWMENCYDSTIQKPSLRSGSWVANAGMLRCSARNYNDPNNRSNDIGFRIVRSLKMI